MLNFDKIKFKEKSIEEGVVEWDYVDYLLDNLSKLRKDIRIIRTIKKAIISPYNNSNRDTLHCFCTIESFTSMGMYPHIIQFNYFTYNSEKIVSPYLEITHYIKYIEYLEYVFSKQDVFEILRQLKTIKKSKISQKPISIIKTKSWNYGIK